MLHSYAVELLEHVLMENALLVARASSFQFASLSGSQRLRTNQPKAIIFTPAYDFVTISARFAISAASPHEPETSSS